MTATDPHSSDWYLIDQPMVDRFADAIDDHQFIHTDPARARAETAYGGTIVHGFYLLSLLTRLSAEDARGKQVERQLAHELQATARQIAAAR